ncbi:MAG TPA: hypothetical protein VH370_11555 [Humisphaera sp.]|nr:hypothetical protein [Humisphaera sp.]
MRSKLMKTVFPLTLLTLAFLLAGCLPFPLGSPQKSVMDAKLAGYWLNSDDERLALITLYPYDEHTYMAQTAEFKKGDNPELTSLQNYKAWLTTIKGATFITLEPLVQRLPSSAEGSRFYVVARLIPSGQSMQVKPIDTDFEPLKSVKSAEEETEIITKNMDDPKLYGNSSTTYSHVDPEKDKEVLEPLLKLFK